MSYLRSHRYCIYCTTDVVISNLEFYSLLTNQASIMSVSLAIKTMMVTTSAIDNCNFNSINSIEFSKDDVRRFKHILVTTAKSILLLVREGVHGHVYLLETITWYHVLTGVNYIEADRLNKIAFTAESTNSVLAQ